MRFTSYLSLLTLLLASSAFGGVYTWNGNNGTLSGSPVQNKDDIIFTPNSVDLTLYGTQPKTPRTHGPRLVRAPSLTRH